MAGVMRLTDSLRARKLLVGVVAAGVLMALTAGAVAGILSSLGVAKQTVAGKSETIVVDRRGVTVYELSGESLAHLQCTTRTCLNIWLPVEVRSAGSRPPKAAGVPGTLSILRRVRGGFYQVMLDRHPLYYYSGDGGNKGSTKGQGINSFGGSWHVVKAS
jgi:predicted lipoprotein with Yx(FWY)xxD motif